MLHFLKWLLKSERSSLVIVLLILMHVVLFEAPAEQTYQSKLRPYKVPLNEHHTPINKNLRHRVIPKQFYVNEASEEPRGNSYSGTAWAFNNNGKWVTARHVIDDCKKPIYLAIPSKKTRSKEYLKKQGSNSILKVTKVKLVDEHTNYDLAILSGGISARYISISDKINGLDAIGMEAYGMGFPNGEPGDAHLQLIGSSEALYKKRSLKEPVFAWAIKSKPNLQSLGGISGGPLLDKNGNSVGTATVENRRRGRLYASRPSSIKTFITENGYKAAIQNNDMKINNTNYILKGDALRKAHAIAKVICIRNT